MPMQLTGIMFTWILSNHNAILTMRNPAGNAAALTITPLAVEIQPVSAHLVIMQIQ